MRSAGSALKRFSSRAVANKDMSVVVRVLCVVMCVCGVNAYYKRGLLLWLILIKIRVLIKNMGVVEGIWNDFDQ